MSLDLTGIAGQVGEMVARLKTGNEERQAHLRRALEIARDKNLNLDHLKNKIVASQGKITWLVAIPVNGLANRCPSPPLPPDFNIIAADGSHIDVDRHKTARCYLINIGAAVLSYGAAPGARLESYPRLYSDGADLVIKSPDKKAREQQVEGALLGMKRNVEECHKLVELALEMPPGTSSLAMIDGTLILWGLEQFPDFIIEVLLDRGFLACLDELKKANKDRKLPVASYISYPRSADVVNALRLAICPHEPADCDRYCPGGEGRACDAVSGIQDRTLFADILAPGERSDVFITQSSIVEKRYGPHRVYFFYLRADEEVGRIEVPEWVALNKDLLNLTHALVLDQCRRGQGYPVALSEAHEQAVVTGADREDFWQLVESAMVEEHMPVSGSMKNLSKKTRWI